MLQIICARHGVCLPGVEQLVHAWQGATIEACIPNPRGDEFPEREEPRAGKSCGSIVHMAQLYSRSVYKC